MGTDGYWSVEHCRWEPVAVQEHHWSVQRCRWEPAGPVTDALATPWSVFGVAQAGAGLPQQREPVPGRVEA